MQEFRNKVAVITGAASGMGRCIAERCAQEGMKVVLAGINEANLVLVEQELKATGATILSVRTDVSKRADVEALAQRTLDAFGAIHLLVNNAGVGGGSSPWESTWADWEWLIGVNLWGVIYGVKIFTPIMLAQDTECHIVNNSSIAGLMSCSHAMAPYGVTKHAVVALSENLHHSLLQKGSKVKVSVLCTQWVRTRIMEYERNRPPEFRNIGMEIPDEQVVRHEQWVEAAQAGMDPKEVAEHVFTAIRNERFYILTHPETYHDIQVRMENILQGRNPA